MKIVKIDVTKINKEYLFKGNKGTYLDVLLHDNRDGRDEYGNDGMVTQSIPKDLREQGQKGPIIGSWRDLDTRPKAQQSAPKPPLCRTTDDSGDDLPF